MDKQQKSPTPPKQPDVPGSTGQAGVQPEILPICPGTGTPVKQIRHLDYGGIRVVFDTDTRIVLGVMKAE